MSQGKIACPPPEDAREPAFLRALQPEVVEMWILKHLGAGARLDDLRADYVRWKERDGCLVGYRVRLAYEGVPTEGYVTIRTAERHRVEDEAGRIEHRQGEVHDGLFTCALLPDEPVLLLAFPLDRVMPDLRRMVRASKVRSLLESLPEGWMPAGSRFSKSRSRCTLARYKPERRAVVRWDAAFLDTGGASVSTRTLWIRCYAEPLAVLNRAATDAARSSGVRTTRTLLVPHERLLVESHLDGAPWIAGTSSQDQSAARTLARLHLGRGPASLPIHGPLPELDRILCAVEDLARLRRELGATAAVIADTLARTVPAGSKAVFCHGDFHPGQVLIQDGDAGFCDFDRACLAPVAHDLATLYTHLLLADAGTADEHFAAFLEAYAQHAAVPEGTELAWWQACALVRAAIHPFRALRPDWPEKATEMLALAARICREKVETLV
jgi:thiamine kinase-like enzyme